jgi:DNA-binding FadR family transcriptional regulator
MNRANMTALHQARRSLVDLAVEDIGQRLAAGQWPVGSRIPTEPELATLLGISRNTVREAIRVCCMPACWRCAREMAPMYGP